MHVMHVMHVGHVCQRECAGARLSSAAFIMAQPHEDRRGDFKRDNRKRRADLLRGVSK
jgi:hypothetical protein